MKITNNKAYIEITQLNKTRAQIRYWSTLSIEYYEKNVSLSTVANLLSRSELEYYLDENITNYQDKNDNLVIIGNELYRFLNQEEGILDRIISSCEERTLVIAISVEEKLSHLPWEVLHDGSCFLTQRNFPAIVPMRWVQKNRLIFLQK